MGTRVSGGAGSILCLDLSRGYTPVTSGIKQEAVYFFYFCVLFVLQFTYN